MNILYLGFAVDEGLISEILKNDKNMPIQTHKFAWNLIRTLKNTADNLHFISSAPVSNYPQNSRILFKGASLEIENVRGIYLPFINFVIIKHITRFLSALIIGGRYIYQNRPDFVIVHGLHSPYVVSAYIYSLIFNIKVVAVVTDPPSSFLPGLVGVNALVRKIDKIIISFFINKINGIIVLARQLALELCPNVPFLLMQGFFSDFKDKNADVNFRSNYGDGDFHVAYAGGLSDEYGVSLFLDCLEYIDDCDFKFHFFGSGKLSEEIISRAKIDSRVIFHGFVSPEILIPKLRAVDILINPRPTNQKIVHLTFPSKLFEYISLGVPVLTTRLPNLPSEFDHCVHVLDEETPLMLAKKLVNIKITEQAKLKINALKAREILLFNFGFTEQGARIKKFLNSL